MKKDVESKSNHTKNKQGSSEYDEPLYLAIGKLRRAHGIRGEILMEVITDFPERITPGKDVYIGSDYENHKIIGCRNHAKGLLIAFENVTNRSEAEKLQNRMVYISSTDVTDLPEDTYYHHQLIGLKIIDEENNDIGTLKEILETGANDVYVILSTEGKELLLPAIKSVIKNISPEKGNITVDLPEWL